MKETPIDYRSVRSDIATGDLLLYQGNNPISWLIRKFTDSRYSHAGMAAYWKPSDDPATWRLMVFEAVTPYVTVRPASESIGRYRGAVRWYRLRDEHRAALNEDRFFREAMTCLGLEFSVSGLFDYLWWKLGLAAQARQDGGSPRRLFCSEYVSRCFTMALEDPCKVEPDHYTSPEALSKSALWEPRERLRISVHDETTRSRTARSELGERARERRGRPRAKSPP